MLEDDASFPFLCHVQVRASVFLGVSMIHQVCGVDRFRKTLLSYRLVNIGIPMMIAMLVTTRIVSMNPSGGPMIDYHL